MVRRCRALSISLLSAAICCLVGCGSDDLSGDREAVAADHYLAGQLYVDQGELSLALEELSKAVEFNPKLGLAHSRMGSIYKTLGQLQNAARSFEKAVELDPHSFRDQVELAGVYSALGELADAIRVYLAAITLRPDDYQAHFELGALHYRRDNLVEAEKCFFRCIELDATRPDAHTHLGVVYDRQGRYHEASRAFNQSLECKLDQPDVMVLLAGSYLRQGRFIGAKDALEYARDHLNDRDPTVHEGLAFCYFRLAGLAEDEPAGRERAARLWLLARDSYLRAVELNGNNPDSLAGLGTVLMKLALMSPDPVQKESLRIEAVEYWHRSLELNPKQPKIIEFLRDYGPQRQAGEMRQP